MTIKDYEATISLLEHVLISNDSGLSHYERTMLELKRMEYISELNDLKFDLTIPF